VPAEPLPAWNEKQVAGFEKLEAIRKRYIEDSPHQHFVTDHHSIVFGDGDPCARLMFIGEAPGADEDKVGKPFVGRAGQLLEKMIIAMGLSRSQVYIANVLKTRPPNNATPTLEEAQLCAPYLYDQVVAVAPLVIVTLGLPATRLVLKTDQSMSALRGRWASFTYKGFTVPVMPTYHPAFLLRSYTPENRGKVWSDLQQAMTKLGMSPTAQASEKSET
jgi:DNA polymerase